MISDLDLAWHGGRLLCRRGGDEPRPVRLVWPRPVSAWDGEIAVVDAEHGTELALLPSLAALSPAARRLAEEALARRYLVPTIRDVRDTRSQHGVRYWTVDTDLGNRRFAYGDPARHVVWIDEDRLVIKDAHGNRYRIASLRALDAAAQERVLRVV